MKKRVDFKPKSIFIILLFLLMFSAVPQVSLATSIDLTFYETTLEAAGQIKQTGNIIQSINPINFTGAIYGSNGLTKTPYSGALTFSIDIATNTGTFSLSNYLTGQMAITSHIETLASGAKKYEMFISIVNGTLDAGVASYFGINPHVNGGLTLTFYLDKNGDSFAGNGKYVLVDSNVVPVPIPAAALLLGSGLMGLLGIKRKARSKIAFNL